MPWNAPDTRPGDDHPVDLTLLDGIVLAAWTILGQLVVGLVVGVSAVLLGADLANLDGDARTSLLLTVLVQSGVLFGLLAWLAARGRLSWRLAGSRRPRFGHVAAGVGFGAVALATAFTVGLLGTWLTGSGDDSGQRLLEPDVLAGSALALNLVIVAVLAPLIEEITFRGVLFQVLGRRIGWVPAMLLSSALWALVHVEIVFSGGNALVFLASLFALGCVFCISFNRTRSLVVPIVAHGVFNASQLLLARWAELG